MTFFLEKSWPFVKFMFSLSFAEQLESVCSQRKREAMIKSTLLQKKKQWAIHCPTEWAIRQKEAIGVSNMEKASDGPTEVLQTIQMDF